MIERYYLYDDELKIVYYAEELPESSGSLIMLGTSNNPKPSMAAAVFLKNGTISEGFRLRPIQARQY